MIVAWANGAQIEYHNVCSGWKDAPEPSWYVDTEYRIKPTKPVEPPKPEWIKVDGVRPEGIPDGTKVEWVTKDGRSNVCLISSLDFKKGSAYDEVIFIKIVL